MGKKLSKLKNDIKYLNVDGTLRCTFNQCIDKFVPDQEVHTVYPKWNDNKPVSSVQEFHRCTDCGKKVYGKGDKSQTYYNYLSAVAGNGPLTPPEQETMPKNLRRR